MIWAGLLGAMAAASQLSYLQTLQVVVAFVTVKGVWEINVNKRVITGTPSAYTLFVEGLERSGRVPPRPWIPYLLQMLLWGALIGSLTYAGARWVLW